VTIKAQNIWIGRISVLSAALVPIVIGIVYSALYLAMFDKVIDSLDDWQSSVRSTVILLYVWLGTAGLAGYILQGISRTFRSAPYLFQALVATPCYAPVVRYLARGEFPFDQPITSLVRLCFVSLMLALGYIAIAGIIELAIFFIRKRVH
jgi:hypothetical protein